MPANYERVLSVSRLAGADYTGNDGAGLYRFAIINPNPIAAGSYTNPQVPGLWYGSAAGAPAIPAGNVIVNTTAGGDCDYVIVGKALPGQPIECAFSGRVLVVVGAGGVAAGQSVSSDAAGQAIAHTSGNHILGTANETGVAGDIVSINFARRGVA